jgi:hypothetical protein
MDRYFPLILVFALLLGHRVGHCQQVSVKLENQVSGWAGLRTGDTLRWYAGSRYIPVLSIADSLAGGGKIDAECSVRAHGNLYFNGKEYDRADKSLKPYRFWVRYSTPHLEIRAGLQKINFGSASILRPLMWFDQMDSRDPLQITDGVYALLGRYYFRNNANIWLWGLYGNNKPRGWEAVPGLKKFPEWGGRFQIPVPSGEAAISIHHRKADFSAFYPPGNPPPVTRHPETKVSLDGKWDIGPGLSFEYVVKHNDPANGILPRWETYLNLGIDYTLAVGNGIGLATEFFRYSGLESPGKKGTDFNYSVLTCNYPFGLLNSVTALVYFDWERREWYRFLSLKREYDFWSFYLMAFLNPDKNALYQAGADKNLFAGRGFQVMAVLNF